MTNSEAIEIITKAVNEDLDGEIFAVRKSDNYREVVVSLLGSSDTIENYISEMETETNKLVEFSNWEIAGFEYELD